jgi:tryptophanyl-tRNA synthetase
MSKSDTSDYSRINMTDDADAVALKIRKAKTDPHPLPGPTALTPQGAPDPAKEAERPEAFNLLGIYAALSDNSLKDVVTEFEGREFSFFKQVLTDLAVATVGQVGNEMKRLMNDPAEIDAVLRDGAESARAIAAPILREVEDIVGFLRP